MGVITFVVPRETTEAKIKRILYKVCNCRKWAEEYRYEVCSADEWLCTQIMPESLCKTIEKCARCPECSELCRLISELMELCGEQDSLDNNVCK